MIEKELLMKKANEGYTVCYEELCPLRDHCLRWQVGQHVPSTACAYTCVNPNYKGVSTTECTMYRKDQKVHFAKGMSYVDDYDW